MLFPLLMQAPGNAEPYLSLVEKLTGAPLTAAAWVKELQVKGRVVG